MNHSGRKAAGLIAALLTNSVLAMGLGEASGRAVLGQPLHLEIPILGGDGSALKNCLRLRAPRTEVGNDFAARSARIEVVGTRLVVTTTIAVTEPVIGFAVDAACAGIFRDYVMLVGLPVTPPPAPAIDAPRATTLTETSRPAKAAPEKTPVPANVAPEKTAVPDDALHIPAPLALKALARQKYPLQPKAREKFMRMMMEANPGLISIDTPIAAGTELRLPAGLPQRRIGPYLGEGKKAEPQQQPAPRETAAVVPPTAQSAPAPKGGKDRLVLGRVPESNEAQLLAEAERLTNILIDQTRVQEDVTSSLDRMEADYAALHKHFIEMQTRLARMEAERAAEKQAAENSTAAQLVKLVAAVLGGGAVGGLGLHLFQRRRWQTKADDDGFGKDAMIAAVTEPPRDQGLPAAAERGTPDFHTWWRDFKKLPPP